MLATSLQHDHIYDAITALMGGVYTVDQKRPTVNSRPHFSNKGAGHLYADATGGWILNSTLEPAAINVVGSLPTTEEARPVGRRIWQCMGSRTGSGVRMLELVEHFSAEEAEAAAAKHDTEVAAWCQVSAANEQALRVSMIRVCSFANLHPGCWIGQPLCAPSCFAGGRASVRRHREAPLSEFARDLHD
eukprot:SAG31_NODE_567_length_14028_cov_4.022328_13_plen_189_part_00